NDAPVAVNGTLTTAEDTPAIGTLNATDVDGDALTYTIVTNGTKGTATIINAATGAFTYTPAANANGADSITFKAHDASIEPTVAKSHAVHPTPPTGAFTHPPNANANGTNSITFKANDGILDSAAATVSITITPVNDPPVAADGALATLEDTPANGTLIATD